MANDLNSCNFIGRLGADTETRYMPNGDAVCSFRIAVGWKSKDKEGAEWVSITAFGKLAEICSQYLVKGSQVFISGRFKTDEYEKDGVKRYSTKIVADKMQMLGGKAEGGSRNEGEGRSEQSDRGRSQGGGGNGAPAKKAANFDDMDDDIPFACNSIESDPMFQQRKFGAL